MRKHPPTHSAKKHFGQHFLHEATFLNRIVEAAGIRTGESVLEIGAGTGLLTRRLAEAVGGNGYVLAFEIDGDLLPGLWALAEALPMIRPVAGDFLKADLAVVLTEHRVSPPISIVGNLPYYITTPILERLLEMRDLWSSATLMVQEEVALRWVASPGEEGCGAISAFLHYHCRPVYCFRVPAGAFSPPPKVRSAVVRLERHPVPPVSVHDTAWLFRVTRAAFGQRRKTLRNALQSLGMSSEHLESAFRSAGIDPSRRGETLSLEEFARLSEALRSRERNSYC